MERLRLIKGSMKRELMGSSKNWSGGVAVVGDLIASRAMDEDGSLKHSWSLCVRVLRVQIKQRENGCELRWCGGVSESGRGFIKRDKW